MSEFLGADNDLIILSMSILSMEEVVADFSFDALNKPTLFVDILSVKEYPRDVLLRVCIDLLVICINVMSVVGFWLCDWISDNGCAEAAGGVRSAVHTSNVWSGEWEGWVGRPAVGV